MTRIVAADTAFFSARFGVGAEAMKSNNYEAARAWNSTARTWDSVIRMAITCFLSLSALMAICSAFIVSALATGEDANIARGALLVFGGLAFALAVSFRKVEHRTWKHWLAICILAAPGALYMIAH